MASSSQPSDLSTEGQLDLTEILSECEVRTSLPDLTKLRKDFYLGDVHVRPMKNPSEAGARRDYKAFRRIMSYPQVNSRVSGPGDSISPETAESMAEDFGSNFGGTSAMFLTTIRRTGSKKTIRRKGSTKVIGFAGTQWKTCYEGWPSLLYGLDPDYWGRGLCTEVVSALTADLCRVAGDEALHNISVSPDTLDEAEEEVLESMDDEYIIQVPPRLLAYSYLSNMGSRRVLEKCGYTPMYSLVYDGQGDDVPEESLCYMFKEQGLAAKLSLKQDSESQ